MAPRLTPRRVSELGHEVFIRLFLLTVVLAGFPALPGSAFAWDLDLLEAADAVAAGTASDRQVMVVFTRNKEINEMALERVIGDATYQQCQSRFFDLNQELTMDAAEQAGLRVKAMKKPERFKPGTDTDAALTTRGEGTLSLDKLKQVERNYQNRIRDYFAKKGVKTPPGNVNTDTDFLPDTDVTPDAEFKKCVDHINENGGTAYSTKAAAQTQAKLESGAVLGADDINAYNREMRRLAREKIEKSYKLRSQAKASVKTDPAEAARLEAKAHLNDAQASKYAKRINKATDQLRRQNGLPPLERNITGLDQADDIIDAARGAGTKLDAIAVHNLQKQAMEKASHELIESAADIIRANGAQEASLRKIIAAEMQTLSPASRARAIQALESRAGADVARRIVKEVRAVAANEAEAMAAQKFSFSDIPKLKVVMIAGTAILMAKTGYDYTIANVKPDDTVLDWMYDMTKNSLWYGSGIGSAYEEAEQEMLDEFRKRCDAGEEPDIYKHATLTWLRAGAYMGRDAVIGLLTLPGALILGWDELTGAAEAERRENISKEFYAVIHKMVMQKQEFDKAYALAAEMGMKGGDVKPFLDCLCHDCGMTFGGSFSPDFDGPGIGPCKCAGPLFIKKTPISSSREKAYECFNQVTKKNYQDAMDLFNQWHKQAMEANAESVRPELERLRKMAAGRETGWKENVAKAANQYGPVREMAAESDREDLDKVITSSLVQAAADDLSLGELNNAVGRLELARETGLATAEIDRLLPDYRRWRDNWKYTVENTIPEIRQHIQNKNLQTAAAMLEQIRLQMTARGGRMLPQLTDHPLLVSLDREILAAGEPAGKEGNNRDGTLSVTADENTGADEKPGEVYKAGYLSITEDSLSPAREGTEKKSLVWKLTEVKLQQSDGWGSNQWTHYGEIRDGGLNRGVKSGPWQHDEAYEASWQPPSEILVPGSDVSIRMQLEMKKSEGRGNMGHKVEIRFEDPAGYHQVYFKDPAGKDGISVEKPGTQSSVSDLKATVPPADQPPFADKGLVIRVLSHSSTVSLACSYVYRPEKNEVAQVTGASVEAPIQKDSGEMTGEWKLNANNYPGVLEISAAGKTLSIRVKYGATGEWEEMADVRYEAISGVLSFRRPWAGNPTFQKYEGTLRGQELHGTFTDNHSPGKQFQWFAVK